MTSSQGLPGGNNVPTAIQDNTEPNTALDLAMSLTLAEMRELLTNGSLTPIQMTALTDRLQSILHAQEVLEKVDYNSLHKGERRPRDEDSDDCLSSKRRCHRDIKYDKVEILKLTSTIREW